MRVPLVPAGRSDAFIPANRRRQTRCAYKGRIGIYVDPRRQGGKINDITKDDMVELVNFQGEEYLYYKPFDIDVAMIRGTTCDEEGNMTMDEEPLFLEALHIAMAAKRNGGIVFAQVKYIAQARTLNPKNVKVMPLWWTTLWLLNQKTTCRPGLH